MANASARTTRRLIVERVAAGWPAAQVVGQRGVSRATVHKWLRRHAEGGRVRPKPPRSRSTTTLSAAIQVRGRR